MQYWLRVLVYTIFGSLIISKSFYIVLLLTWGGLPDWFYSAYMYIGNWPCLVSGTFPYFYDSVGKKGIDIFSGIFDITSAIVNIVGWLPIGLILGLLIKMRRAKGVQGDSVTESSGSTGLKNRE